MRLLLLGLAPGLLLAQAPSTLSFDDILRRARVSPEQYRVEALLAERQVHLRGTQGFLREGPTVGYSAGPRRAASLPTSTDQSLDVDMPLFLSQGTRQRLETSLGKADPVLKESAKREASFHLRQAYLDAWLEERLLQIRETDLATVRLWLKTAQIRFEAGADPAFQVSLVEGELLKGQLDLDEARRRRAQAWAMLRVLAEVQESPQPLADPESISYPPDDNLRSRYESGPLRKAIQARLDLEEQTLRLQAAQTQSRWSLRGSYSKEGEDRIAKVGVAYRFSRPGEGQALQRSTEAQVQSTRREMEMALAELDGRFQVVVQRLQDLPSAEPPRDFSPSIRAVSLRLQEGKERPSEALPMRRQLIEAQASALRRLHATHLLYAELQALTEGTSR